MLNEAVISSDFTNFNGEAISIGKTLEGSYLIHFMLLPFSNSLGEVETSQSPGIDSNSISAEYKLKALWLKLTCSVKILTNYYYDIIN